MMFTQYSNYILSQSLFNVNLTLFIQQLSIRSITNVVIVNYSGEHHFLISVQIDKF